MKPGWVYGTCHGCDNHGPVMVVANGLKCEDCIGGKSTRQAPAKPVKCSYCGTLLKDWKAGTYWGLQVECSGCGWLTLVDSKGLIRELTKPLEILCSSCGEVLQREADSFRCQCGRVVTA